LDRISPWLEINYYFEKERKKERKRKKEKRKKKKEISHVAKFS
jgi:hypothetical protein